jgi:chemotaxis protein methyltransferase CheR
VTGRVHSPGAGSRSETPPLSDAAFVALRDVIERSAGISLNDAKRALVVGRLGGRLKAVGVATFEEYGRLVRRCDVELAVMLDLITTNETQFFREPQHFAFLTRQLVPAWIAAASARQRARRVRVWSAACSTGEEPFSIAMALLDGLLPRENWTIEVVASDLSTRALDRARQAVWPIERAVEIPPDALRRHMLRGVDAQQGTMKASKALQALIRFERVNLVADSLPIDGPFDAIFCRNVLMYFSPDARARTIARLVDRLSPEGVLFVGHAESIAGLSAHLRGVAPTVYARAEVALDPRAAGARR